MECAFFCIDLLGQPKAPAPASPQTHYWHLKPVPALSYENVGAHRQAVVQLLPDAPLPPLTAVPVPLVTPGVPLSHSS